MAKKNLSTKTTMQNLATVIKDTLAYAEDIPVNVSELTNDANYQNATQVEAAIAAQVGRTYRPAGQPRQSLQHHQRLHHHRRLR